MVYHELHSLKYTFMLFLVVINNNERLLFKLRRYCIFNYYIIIKIHLQTIFVGKLLLFKIYSSHKLKYSTTFYVIIVYTRQHIQNTLVIH